LSIYLLKVTRMGIEVRSQMSEVGGQIHKVHIDKAPKECNQEHRVKPCEKNTGTIP